MAAKETPSVPGFAHQLDFMAHHRSQQQQQQSPQSELGKHGFCSTPPSPSPPSFLGSPQQQQQHSGLASPLLPSAMSLRARESSALSLKHIFDQIQQQCSANPNNRVGDAGDLCHKQADGVDMAMPPSTAPTTGGAGGGLRSQSIPDLRKRLPELDLTFRQHTDFPPQTGFGSPISTSSTIQEQQQSVHSLPIGALFNPHPPHWLPPSSSSLHGSGYWPQAAMASRPAAYSKQPTAQLTIFYSGRVNVYDDVPADKAQAIMLLAGTGGTGNSWSLSNMRGTTSIEKERCTLLTASNSSPSAPVVSAPSAPSPTVVVAAGGAPLNSAAKPPVVPQSPAPPTQSCTPPTSPLTVPTTEQPKPQISVKRPHAGIELPHARKASLARFLEKRKDRVQVKPVTEEKGDIATQQPSNHKDKDVEKDCMDCDNTYGNSNTSAKKQCLGRSFSPAPTQVHNTTTTTTNTTTTTLQYQKLPVERRFMD